MDHNITMTDADTINAIAEKLHGLAREKGWYDDAETDGQYMARACSNLHGEVSELWEAHRGGRLHSDCDKGAAMQSAGIMALNCMEEELADVFIRCLDTAQRMRVDIGRAVMLKHAFNATRGHRHGGKLA